jgi:hypothetical protein
MARTIEDIQQKMITDVQADATLAPLLTSTSKVAVWRLTFYIVAVAIWTLDKLFDILKEDIDETISALKPHSLRWYAGKAKAFQLGYNLVNEADYYDNTGFTDDVIALSKIVSYAAVVEQVRGVRIKVAKTIGADLGALTVGELAAFTQYMKEIKDAGVKLKITTAAADNLKLSLRIQYDPLVINSVGARIDGATTTPIKDAIKLHLKNLPFNGVFSIQKIVDAIQAVEGVSDLNVDSVQTRYGALAFTAVNISVIPDAGYLRIEDVDLTIAYNPAA